MLRASLHTKRPARLRPWLAGYRGHDLVLDPAPIGSVAWRRTHGDAAGGARGSRGDRRGACVDGAVDWGYQLVVARFADSPGDGDERRQEAYRERDLLLATQAAAILLTQLAAWLLVAYVGFALLLWPFATRGVVSAFVDAGSSLFTLGFAVPGGAVPAVIVFLAAATGLVILTLQIAYLPTLYAAFNRWETEVALLNARGGFPSWGPELLGRTTYALGSGTSTPAPLPA